MAAEAYAIEHRFDIVLESAMRDPRDFEELAARLRAGGYRVEVLVVAVHESMSRLGVVVKFQALVPFLWRLTDSDVSGGMAGLRR